MSTIYQNLRTDRQYKAATALSKEQFETLLSVFKKLYIPKQAAPYGKHSEPVLTDPSEALFFILHYYKAYPSLENIGLYFGFSQFTASHYIQRLSPVLKACLAVHQPLQACLFKDQQAFEQAFADVDEIFMDVTEIPVERPSKDEKQKELYTGKKKPTPANGSS
jgi:hypothetical protein